MKRIIWISVVLLVGCDGSTSEESTTSSPTVGAVSPHEAFINEATEFVITGDGFPETMAAHIQGADCPAESKQWISMSEYRLTCMHSSQETLTLSVKVQSGGELLDNGKIDILFKDINVADGFDYPIGDRGYDSNGKISLISEQLKTDTNTIYGKTSFSSEDLPPTRTPESVDPSQWRNAQDVGSYNEYYLTGGLHPAEDWNIGSGNYDKGQPIYAVADGKVLFTRSTFKNSGYEAGGWTVALKHKLSDGGYIYSIYSHLTEKSQYEGKLVTSKEALGLTEGQKVNKGEIIGVLANGADMTNVGTHLHFEMRTVKPLAEDLWPHDNGLGYYTHNQKVITDETQMNEDNVQKAMSYMREDGIIDPSDYIRANRIGNTDSMTVTDYSYPDLTPGQIQTFIIYGSNLPPSIAISLEGASCGEPYDVTPTQAKVDCEVPSKIESTPSRLIVGAYSQGPRLSGAENLVVVSDRFTAPEVTVKSADGSLSVAWVGSQKANSYNLYYAKESFSTIDDISNYATLDGGTYIRDVTGGEYTLSGLENEVTYFIVMESVSDDEATAQSDEMSAAPLSNHIPKVKLPVNDTGVTFARLYPGNENTACSSAMEFPQDCYVGRDALAASNKLSKIGGGDAGFDYTRLNFDGSEYEGSGDYTTDPWACVRDNVTGLIWEVKTDYNSTYGDSLHDSDDRYSWYYSDSSKNGGDAGFQNSEPSICYGYTDGDSSSYCNTKAFVARVNAERFCGASDWKLPNLQELESIIHYGKTNPSLDKDYFPNTSTADFIRFWTSTSKSLEPSSARVVNFSSGRDFWGWNKASGLMVRLVRREN